MKEQVEKTGAIDKADEVSTTIIFKIISSLKSDLDA